MAYGDFKDVPRKTITNKLLLNKVFNSEKNPKCYGYQQRLFKFCNILGKKTYNTKKRLVINYGIVS